MTIAAPLFQELHGKTFIIGASLQDLYVFMCDECITCKETYMEASNVRTRVDQHMNTITMTKVSKYYNIILKIRLPQKIKSNNLQLINVDTIMYDNF